MTNNLLIIGSHSKIASAFITKHGDHYNVYGTDRIVMDEKNQKFKLDLADLNSVHSFIQKLSLVKFDSVVCFASTYYHQPIPDLDTINSDLQVNFLGIYHVIKNLNLQENSKIILISDSSLYQPKKAYFGYNVSKTLLNLYSKQLAVDLAPNTSTNLICLGPVMTDKSGESKTKYFGKSIIQVSKPHEGLINLIDFLLREKNLYMTGTEIIYDGGRLLKRIS